MVSFPTALEYKPAILDPARFLLDPVLRGARAEVIALGPCAEPFQISGGFARVYKFIAADGRRYAFRCWTADIGDAAGTYRHIDRHLRSLNSEYFVDFAYLNEAVLVGGAKYPGLRMDWVEAPSLQEVVRENLGNRALLEQLAGAFLRLAAYLDSVQVAHGDLQADNIKVRLTPGGPSIVLIDYDTMYVPALRGQPCSSSGLPSYQHPRRADSKLRTHRDDYFPQLVIYSAILALARCPGLAALYRQSPDDKDLLFSAADFADPHGSQVLNAMRNCGDVMLVELAGAMSDACQAPSIDQVRPLANVVARSAARCVGGFTQLIDRRHLPRTPQDMPVIAPPTDAFNAAAPAAEPIPTDIFAFVKATQPTPVPPPQSRRRKAVKAMLWSLVALGIIAAVLYIASVQP